MTNYKQLCVELLAALENEGYAHWTHHTPDEDELCLRARAELAEPEMERLTVQEISDLPQHRQNYIGEGWDDEIQLDGYFSRADLQQLADSIPNTHD